MGGGGGFLEDMEGCGEMGRGEEARGEEGRMELRPDPLNNLGRSKYRRRIMALKPAVLRSVPLQRERAHARTTYLCIYLSIGPPTYLSLFINTNPTVVLN